jgi:hypothetical protein
MIVDDTSLLVFNCDVIVVAPDIDGLGVPRDVFRFDFVKELLCCMSISGLGNVGIDARADVPILDVKKRLLLLFDTLDGLFVGRDFFLNNGVNILCSSKRRIITGCITDDKYERL